MRILRIRCRANGTLIKFANEGCTGTLTSDEAAGEGFQQALDGLRPVFQHVVGLPGAWLERLTVTGLTLTPAGEANYKVVLVGKREMEAGSPVNLATPIRYLHEGAEDEKEVTKLALPSEHARLIQRVLRQAEVHVLGLRPMRQLYLFDMGTRGEGPIIEGELVGAADPAAEVPVSTEPKKRTRKGRKTVPFQPGPPAAQETAAAAEPAAAG